MHLFMQCAVFSVSVFFHWTVKTHEHRTCPYVRRDDSEVRCAAIWIPGVDSLCHQHEFRGVAWHLPRNIVCMRVRAQVYVCPVLQSNGHAAAWLPPRSLNQLFISMSPLVSLAPSINPKWAWRLKNVKSKPILADGARIFSTLNLLFFVLN